MLIYILFLFQYKITQYQFPQGIEPKSVPCCPVVTLSPILSFFLSKTSCILQVLLVDPYSMEEELDSSQ